jgi:hypothetical protein
MLQFHISGRNNVTETLQIVHLKMIVLKSEALIHCGITAKGWSNMGRRISATKF